MDLLYLNQLSTERKVPGFPCGCTAPVVRLVALVCCLLDSVGRAPVGTSLGSCAVRRIPGFLDAVPMLGLVKGSTGRDWTWTAGKTQSFVLLSLSSGGALYSGSFS